MLQIFHSAQFFENNKSSLHNLQINNDFTNYKNLDLIKVKKQDKKNENYVVKKKIKTYTFFDSFNANISSNNTTTLMINIFMRFFFILMTLASTKD